MRIHAALTLAVLMLGSDAVGAPAAPTWSILLSTPSGGIQLVPMVLAGQSLSSPTGWRCQQGPQKPLAVDLPLTDGSTKHAEGWQMMIICSPGEGQSAEVSASCWTNSQEPSSETMTVRASGQRFVYTIRCTR